MVSDILVIGYGCGVLSNRYETIPGMPYMYIVSALRGNLLLTWLNSILSMDK